MGPFATHRLLTRLTLSSAHIFAWLFVFQYFFVLNGSFSLSLVQVSLAYALTQVVSVLLTPFTARRLRHGARSMLINALLALAGAFASLAAAFAGSLGSIGIGIALFAVCMGAYRALYWIPYEISSRRANPSRYEDIALSLVPALAGYFMSTASFAPLLVLSFASVVALLALVPLLYVADAHEGFSWKYRETFHHLFTRKYRIPLLQSILHGFEGTALLLLWPIVVLVLLDWSYAALGMVLSATLLATLLISGIIGKRAVHIETPIMQSVLSVSGWILRGTVAAPLSIILVDTYFQVAGGSRTRGVDLLTTEQSADSNTYVDEITALKEMGQGIGRIIFCLLIAAFAASTNFALISLEMFIIAGTAAVFSIVLSRGAGKSIF